MVFTRYGMISGALYYVYNFIERKFSSILLQIEVDFRWTEHIQRICFEKKNNLQCMENAGESFSLNMY